MDNTMTKRKRTNNDLQKTTQKTKDWATWMPLKTWDEHRWHRRVSSSCSTSGTRRVALVINHSDDILKFSVPHAIIYWTLTLTYVILMPFQFLIYS